MNNDNISIFSSNGSDPDKGAPNVELGAGGIFAQNKALKEANALMRSQLDSTPKDVEQACAERDMLFNVVQRQKAHIEEIEEIATTTIQLLHADICMVLDELADRNLDTGQEPLAPEVMLAQKMFTFFEDQFADSDPYEIGYNMRLMLGFREEASEERLAERRQYSDSHLIKTEADDSVSE
jgi:hypothetical protein